MTTEDDVKVEGWKIIQFFEWVSPTFKLEADKVTSNGSKAGRRGRERHILIAEEWEDEA